MTKSLAAATRLNLGIYANAVGDTDVARRAWERVVADYRDDRVKHYRDIARVASDRLAELD